MSDNTHAQSGNRQAVGLVLIWLIVLVAAGCGGAGGQSSTDAKHPTMDEFVLRANEICHRGGREIALAALALKPDPSPAEIKRYVLRDEVPSLRRQTREIAALPAPAAYRGTIDKMVGAAEASLGELRAKPLMVKSLSTLFSSTVALARKLGLTACNT